MKTPKKSELIDLLKGTHLVKSRPRAKILESGFPGVSFLPQHTGSHLGSIQNIFTDHFRFAQELFQDKKKNQKKRIKS